jgi:RNA polymerase sigma-70 factor (sigma-E family)
VFAEALSVAVVKSESDADFAALFTAHRAGAFRLARLLTDDEASAEDLVADAFARMYPQWRRGRVDEPSAYLRTVIVNAARSGWRRRAVARRFVSRVATPSTTSDSSSSVSDRDLVQRALATLPPAMRATVALRFLGDLSEADTARVLGVSAGTVKAQVSRGMQRLRAALEVDGNE